MPAESPKKPSEHDFLMEVLREHSAMTFNCACNVCHEARLSIADKSRADQLARFQFIEKAAQEVMRCYDNRITRDPYWNAVETLRKALEPL